jgi:flagellin FlaB
MIGKIRKAIRQALGKQKGITGLETAIILIAFVTVASVLAYAVLSAGIFSAERGKETVYEGLKHAQATMESKGATIATSSDNLTVEHIKFNVALVLKGVQVDFTAPTPGNPTITVIRYTDENISMPIDNWTQKLLSTERGNSNILEADEQMEIDVPVPTANTTLGPYQSFIIQVLPPTGSALTIQRTMGGSIKAINNLN